MAERNVGNGLEKKVNVISEVTSCKDAFINIIKAGVLQSRCMA